MLNELIERLEKATGPDRRIDSAIKRLIGLRSRWCPHFTSSLDAALTLVPEGWEWRLGGEVPSESGEAQVFGKGDDIHTAFVSAPAIALCIAALKARAAQIS